MKGNQNSPQTQKYLQNALPAQSYPSFLSTFPKKSQQIYEHKRLTRNVQNDEIVRDFCLSAAEHKLLDPLITRTKSLSQAL